MASAQDWNRHDWDRLWVYNLHYFEDLNAESSADRRDWHRALLFRWISENPPGLGPGWEPYPLSLRIVNWIKWLWRNPVEMDARILFSLAVQVRYLRQRLEHHLLGNHLFENAKALVFASCFFCGDEADAWRDQGMALLGRELDEQILPDGGHFERSPMYQGLILEGMLDLIQAMKIAGEIPPSPWVETASRMVEWLAVMSHPDGEIVLFNDAAIGISASPEALISYARDMGLKFGPLAAIGNRFLRDTGYVRLQRDDATLFADMAMLGPDYLPAHGHADTLGYEFSVNGRRVIVDTGVSGYASGGTRQWERGTRAHNTICIDGKDSSEVYSAFRVGRRARVLNPHYAVIGDRVEAAAGHDGYAYLPGSPIHRRYWSLESGQLTVIDELEGAGKHEYEVRIHLHPDWVVTEADNKELMLSDGDGSVLSLRLSGPLSCRSEDYAYHPEFGLTLPAQVVVAGGCGNLPIRIEMTLNWEMVC
ncbi:MAG: alginate lyase family protein [Gammaproteobacteria bacterium]|nr:alginate lyase family protein [Gammaproteobacteria bacterium]MCP5135970.1 alginate lyase family protein [Gammaproteobacteria bacterium]